MPGTRRGRRVPAGVAGEEAQESKGAYMHSRHVRRLLLYLTDCFQPPSSSAAFFMADNPPLQPLEST